MVAVTHLISPAALPNTLPMAGGSSQECLSVLSWNVLLPNSVDAWWNYKMYNGPALATRDLDRISSWDFRRELLKRRISITDADVVCLQEVCPISFEDDFRFMEELGYEGVELFRKGRFRPATFWKTSKVELASEPVHKDRTLLTAFRLQNCASRGSDKERAWYVLNCHLQAGKEGPRRLRQINEGVRASMTLARKLKEPEPEKLIRLIVCGDFNGGAECGAVRYLEDGFASPEFLEDGEPVTSRVKAIPLSASMQDATTFLERDPPPTMVVPELISVLIQKGTNDDPKFSEDMLDRLERIFVRFASQEVGKASRKVMSIVEVEKWLATINRKVGRGDEFREAARQMGWKEPAPNMPIEQMKASIKLPQNGVLTLEGFLAVYEKELKRGKFWGIAHDMSILGEPLPDAGLFTARYDRMYCSSALRPIAVLDTLCKDPCPNEAEPSDHLPVAALFVTS